MKCYLSTIVGALALWLPCLTVIGQEAESQIAKSVASGVVFNLSDAHPSSDETEGHAALVVPSSAVCHHPGFPRKPLWDRPGDRNASEYPPIRYCQNEGFRAGWPESVRKHAICSINSHYSAWYVGGGSAWIFPHGRQRKPDEGTWGLDYSLFHYPKSIWMKWTPGREQGGLGAYSTDHKHLLK